MRYAAGIALLIAAAKLWDHVQDGDGLPGPLLPPAGRLARSRLAAAEKRLSGLGFDAGQVCRQLEAQASVESRPGMAFFAYSRPTELAVGAVFAHTAVLAQQPANFDPLYEMGRSFGRILLLLDSAQDYDADLLQGRFNALAAAHPGEGRQPEAQEIFRRAHADLRQGYAALALPQPGLLPALLLSGLGRDRLSFARACARLRLPPPASMTASRATHPAGGARMAFPEDRRLCSCRVLPRLWRQRWRQQRLLLLPGRLPLPRRGVRRL